MESIQAADWELGWCHMSTNMEMPELPLPAFSCVHSTVAWSDVHNWHPLTLVHSLPSSLAQNCLQPQWQAGCPPQHTQSCSCNTLGMDSSRRDGSGMEQETWILHQLHRHWHGSPLAEAVHASWELPTHHESCPQALALSSSSLWFLKQLIRHWHLAIWGKKNKYINKNQKQEGKCCFSKRMKWVVLLLSKILTSCCLQLSAPEHPLPSVLSDPKSKDLQKTWQELFWPQPAWLPVTVCLEAGSYNEHIYPTTLEHPRQSPSITEGLMLRLQAAEFHTVTDQLRKTKVQKHGRK